MAKKSAFQRCGNAHQIEVGKILKDLSYRHGLWQVFRDFVAMAALAMSNAADATQREAREAEYMRTVQRYTAEEASKIAQAFAITTLGLEAGPHDFLGSLFMALDLGDAWKGQYFTPYELARLMARMNMDAAKPLIESRGFVRVSDPCVGGGAMIIAAAHALIDEGINYQQCMHAHAQDIDLTAVHMAYVQLSLLHIPAVVVHGNSLTDDVRSTWVTLAHTMGGWNSRLRALTDVEALADAVQFLTSSEPHQPAPPVAPRESAENTRHPSLASQISLF